MHKTFTTLLFLFLKFISEAQVRDSLHISLFADTYFATSPEISTGKRLPYQVNYDQFNKVDLNFLCANIHYTDNHFRTNLGVMTGRYADQNLAVEDPLVRNIYQANIGYRFTSDEEIWLDAGILPSHIGFESVPSNQNWTGTRSLIADLSPYYETGLRLSYRPNQEWYFSIMALNGWQRITSPLNQFGESWGMQVTYRPEPNWTINSSSFIGKISFDSVATTRVYSNLYSTLQLNPRMWVMAGWDWGVEGNSNNQWHDFMLQYRYSFLYNKLYGNFRYEYLSDPAAIFRPDILLNRHQLHMTSLNIDYLPVKRFMLRAEAAYLMAESSIIGTFPPLMQNNLSFTFITTIQLDYRK